MLNKRFQQEIKPELQKKMDVENPLAVPTVEKVVINMRIPEGKETPEAVIEPSRQLAQISGQKPKICRARQSISGFQLSQGDPVGLKVTLRNKRMYDFLERLFNLVLPRVKDFRGLPADQFDQAGNYNLSLADQTAFPEINIDKIDKSRSLQIAIVTSTDSIPEAKQLLLDLGLPLAKKE